MGGKNAVILLADADLDKALGGIVQGAFGSTGQRCTATSRVIVEETVYDEFMQGLLERTAALRIGDGIDPGGGCVAAVRAGAVRQGAGVHRRWGRGGRQPGLRRPRAVGRRV